MPQKATKSKKRSRRSGSEESGNSQDGKKSAPSALSKFEEFDVAEVLQKEREAEQALSDGRLVDTGVVDDFGASALAPVTPPSAGEALEIPVAAIPQLIPPEPLRDLPPDEEFVPLPTLQVVPMMNRVSEAQSGLLKEPAPPASIHRVTVPGAPVPAMPTALMELLTFTLKQTPFFVVCIPQTSMTTIVTSACPARQHDVGEFKHRFLTPRNSHLSYHTAQTSVRIGKPQRTGLTKKVAHRFTSSMAKKGGGRTRSSLKPTKLVPKHNVPGSAPTGTVSDLPEKDPLASVSPVALQSEGVSLGDGLYNAIVQNTSTDAVVAEVLRIYGEGSTSAVCCAVLNLVGRVAGVVNGELDEGSLGDSADVAALLDEMYARVPDGVSGYLLVQRDTGHQKTRKGFRNFFIRLVECSYSANVLLDDTLFPTLLKWLLAMSESKARCFRHTSTFVLLCIVDALSGVVGALNSRLYSQRGDKKRAATQQRCIQAMVDMRQNIVSHAVHQRARDVAPEIRLMVFTNLAQWILNYDDDFAENKYFRYFGMALSDKRPEIRTEALMMIHTTLSKTPDSGGRMFLFLQYFAKRLVEMCRDVHMRCAELAIGAIRLMLTVYGATAEEKGLLDNEMVDRSLWSLFDDRPTIRQEAGALLLAFIESRLPTEETTEEGRWTEAVQLLHSFASSLRSQCGESMPEKYLVDAIFTSASPEPPQLLQHYKSILPLVVSDEVSDSIVGISFCAALLEKLRGRLDLGPVPREDRRQTTSRKVAQAKQDALNDLASSLSLDVGVMLADAIEKHRGDIRVLASVASVIVAMDLKVFGSLGHTSKIKSLITLFRKATASLSHCEEAHMRQIASAWCTLVSEDHPHQKEAVGQLQELRRNVVKQLISLRSGASRSESREGEEFLHVWTRVNILSSLVSLLDQWDLLKSAITDHCRATTSAELLRLMVVSCSHCVLWKLQAAKEVNGDEFTSIEVVTSYGDVGQFVGELVAIIFKVWSVEPAEGGEQHFSLLTDCLISLCDFCALPYYTLSQIEQDTLVTKFADVSRKLGSAAREMREELRKAEVQFEKEGVYAAVTEHHRRLNRLEATQMRVTVGVVRLFLLNRIAGSNAPMILLQWMYAPSRAVSDVFRHLFRALRDRSEDSFSLEQSILVAAYHHSSEALCQMGQRLSSMHWPMPDKYYSACVGVVRFGIQFATTTDPAILQGISAYCPKLLKSDALAMVQVLANDERLTKSVDGSVKMFISALLRSAKIEGGPRESALKSRKRPRDTSTTVDVNGSETVVLSEQHSPSQSASIESSSQLPNRLLVADGWRVRPVDRETVERQAKRHSCAASAVISGVEGVNGAAQDEYQFSSFTQQTATQNTFASSQPDELDMSEVLIATRDYE